ncbi:hypothetical protein C8J57DRAFT_14068 [Mycena rebaudengoi]|nr:hypothetical protein C8J57DRAFT_14068 [Mycena rebaudengoi]
MLDDHEQDESAPRNASVDDEATDVAELHHDDEHDNKHVPDNDEDSAEADAEPQQQQNPDLVWLNDVPQERPPSPSKLLHDPAFAAGLLFSFSPGPENTLPELPACPSTDWWSPLLDVPDPTSVQHTTDWWSSLLSGPVPPPHTTTPLFLPSSHSVTPFQPPSREQTPAWWEPSPIPPMPPPPPPSQPVCVFHFAIQLYSV